MLTISLLLLRWWKGLEIVHFHKITVWKLPTLNKVAWSWSRSHLDHLLVLDLPPFPQASLHQNDTKFLGGFSVFSHLERIPLVWKHIWCHPNMGRVFLSPSIPLPKRKTPLFKSGLSSQDPKHSCSNTCFRENGSTHLFSKGLDSKYFWLGRPQGLHGNYSTLL